ncbi:MAG: xanthine dehydrogenase, molybdenum binding subunit apoprotein, partial [Hyphomicrobiales bacterium]|nr:xanthine dehydrogenase, molybdenum binding subunit apoprotein [Hyphomicrobiales bacterium]
GKIEKLEPYRQPVLARGRVRYVGEPVAAVFAIDPYVAEDAADLVEVDVESLPVLTDACTASGEFEDGLSTEAAVFNRGFGDIDLAFAKAHAIVEMELKMSRHSGVPMETRGAIGRYDAANDVLELHGAAKIPHKNRESLARIFSRSTSRLHLIEYHVGGGFGVRGEIYPEDILVLAASLRFELPIKWIEDRREHFIATNHSRQQHHKIRAAVDESGVLLGLEDEFWHDQGAYPRTHAMRVAETTCSILPGPYRLPAYKVTAHYRLTNKTPAATYRAPGRYETNFVRERLLDLVAAKLNISRVEIRRRNLLSVQEMPYARPSTHDVFDSGDYVGLLDKSLARFEWHRVKQQVAERRAKGELVGLGIALFVEKSGMGPTDGAKVSVDETGSVEVLTGGASVGQGFETVMAQVCAEALGVDYHKVRVVHGRTDRIEFGIGAHASRATVMTANAVHVAANEVRAKALDFAAELLQSEPDSLDIEAGVISVRRGKLGGSISLGEIASQLRPTSSSRGKRPPGLSSEGWFNAEHETYPYGNQLALVSIDRLTGQVTIERMVVAYDIGRAINPMLVRGQIVGGFVQGLGGALYEEFPYTEEGEPLAVTFADYLLPTLSEVPKIDVILAEDAPSTRNPLGVKGAGESGIAAVGAVIASAVDDALGVPGCVTELPLRPQRVWSLIRETDRILGRSSSVHF